jgi:hypothetical protein
VGFVFIVYIDEGSLLVPHLSITYDNVSVVYLSTKILFNVDVPNSWRLTSTLFAGMSCFTNGLSTSIFTEFRSNLKGLPSAVLTVGVCFAHVTVMFDGHTGVG